LRGLSVCRFRAAGKLEIFSVLLAVTILLLIAEVCADMPEPHYAIYKVEIQGAHKVSEGGNLWFYMINHDNQSFEVTGEYEGGVKCFNHSTPNDYSLWRLDPFVLSVNEYVNIFFQALNVSGQKVRNEFDFWITPLVHPAENESYSVHTDTVVFFTLIEPLQEQSSYPPLEFQITAVLLVVSWIIFAYLGLKRRKHADVSGKK
jgi:hypothetical protein